METQPQPKARKVILLIDLDGTSANWYKSVLTEMKERFPDEKFPEVEELTSYFIRENFDHRFHEHTLDVVTSEGFYRKLEPYALAIQAMKDMELNCQDWLEPFICSKPCHDYAQYLSHSEKVQWVEEHLGKFWAQRTILAPDKTLVHGDYLIDDFHAIKGVNPYPSWIQLLNLQPYNEVHSCQGNLPFNWGMWPEVRDLIKIGNPLITCKEWPFP